jgi:hypothetical protein
MTTNNLFEICYIIWVTPGRQTRTFEQLIGYPLKGGDDHDERLPARFLADNLGHSADPAARCER